MRISRLVGPAVFLVGAVALTVGFLQNQATVSLFVIFPVITATGPWSILGILLMIAGVFLFFLTRATPVEMAPPAAPASVPAPGSPPPVTSGRRWGGVIFLGPIPVVFGSDQKVTRWMLILGAALFVALLVLTVIAVWGI